MSSSRLRQMLGAAVPRGVWLELRGSTQWWVTVALIAGISAMYYISIDFYDTPLSLFLFEVKHDLHGLAYLVPFAYASARMGLAGAIASWGLAFAFALPRILYFSIGPNAELHNILSLTAPFLIVLTVLLELRWREQHAQHAAERERERRLHIDSVFKAQENERHRIAQGLHDDVLQRLMAIAVMSGNVKGVEAGGDSRSAETAERIRDESLRLADELRRLSYDLRPSILDSLGLVPAVDWLLQQLQQETGINVSLYTKGRTVRLDPMIETKVFRMVQEALNNIRQHSQANEATAYLNFSPTRLTVNISDNGAGFASMEAMQLAAEHGHLGLLGMRERVESMEGTLTVASKPGGGTSIVARIPLHD